MKRLATKWAAAVLIVAVSCFVNVPAGQYSLFGASYARADDASRPLNPCAAPNRLGDDAAETAWKLWVAATCPVNQTKYPLVVWENWIEQAQMYPADPSNGLLVPNSEAAGPAPVHHLHGSPLALVRHPGLGSVVKGLLGGADTNCNKASTPPRNQPNLVICEEVRLNGATEDYIAGTDLWNRTGQAQAAAAGRDIDFSKPSVELKADWIELSTIGLDCNNLPAGFTQSIHVEMINGNCFALAGMHMISKLADKWVWATFEPQNKITNPARCAVLGCVDPFGSKPEATYGDDTRLSRKLAALMTAANLSPEWFNYRLDGVQTEFFRPELLGSSIIEGENAGVPLTQSSCISCHAVSSVKSDGTDGITLLTTNPVGRPAPLPSDAWIRRDFLWSLSMACPGSPFRTCAK